MRCLTSARFTMKADILFQSTDQPAGTQGTWVSNQDPDTGEIIRVWHPGDDPNTPDVEPTSIACEARPTLSSNRLFGGNLEKFGDTYTNMDFVMFRYAANVTLTERSRVTNIKDRYKNNVWIEPNGDPTIFDVVGIIPALGPFGEHMHNTALLVRAEVQ